MSEEYTWVMLEYYSAFSESDSSIASARLKFIPGWFGKI